MSVEAAAVTPLTDIGDPKPDGIGLHIWREGQDARSFERAEHSERPTAKALVLTSEF